MSSAKPYEISKQEVWKAYQQIKANRGAAGIDGETIQKFEQDRTNNLYKLWNRLSSGSYHPQPVRRVDIPKGDGKTRPLGIPTLSDRIAQMVVKQALEPTLEKIFHTDSYGYRPNRSAHQALTKARQRCWRYDWVLDLDIKGFFDNIEHDLLMRAVRKHTKCLWVLLYIERWLAAPVQMPDGTLNSTTRGTPQGAVISPLLANLFLHYALDHWMQKHHPSVVFERYADDVIYHCKSQEAAQTLRKEIETRLAECKLELHPVKTKIVYCKDTNRKETFSNCKFDFLGYEFRQRESRNKYGRIFANFTPAVSAKAKKAMRREIRRWAIHRRTDLSLDEIAAWKRPVLRGWVQYYGRYNPSVLRRALFTIEIYIKRWALRKFKRFKKSTVRGWKWLNELRVRQPDLLPHWNL